MISCHLGQVETVKLLLQHGANIGASSTMKDDRCTAFTYGHHVMYTQHVGHTETVKILKSFGQRMEAPFLNVARCSSQFAHRYPLPSPQVHGPSPGWGIGPGSVDSGIRPTGPAPTWDVRPSPAPSWGIGPCPRPASFVGVPSPSASGFAPPLLPAKRSPLSPSSPFFSAHLQIGSSPTEAAPADGQDATGTNSQL